MKVVEIVRNQEGVEGQEAFIKVSHFTVRISWDAGRDEITRRVDELVRNNIIQDEVFVLFDGYVQIGRI